MGLLGRLMSRRPQAVAATGPEDVAAWVKTGYDLQAKGNAEEAHRLFHKVLEHQPRHADALYFLGCSAISDGRELEAIDYFEKAAEARPNDAVFRFLLAGTLFSLGRSAEAAIAFQAGVDLQPENVDMAGNMWMAMLEAGRDEEARIAVERARDAGLKSSQIDATLAGIYRDHGRLEESIAAYRRVLESKPGDYVNYSNMLFALNYLEAYDAAALFAESLKYAARYARPYVAPQPERSWPRKLRIGYVSPDFRAHVVAFFFEPIMENHERSKFEIFCYYSHRADDRFTDKLRSLSDHWLDCVHFSDAELAERIRADRIDILVDLAGHTGDNRLQVFAMKPAPVQATYLGYPGTTGLRAIDYRISDARADPPEADRLSAEQLVRLPDCFHCYRAPSDSPEVGPLPADAAGYITFGCFNNFTKLSPAFLNAAARVLLAVPDSRLWLKSRALGVQYVADRVREDFARAGVDPARIELTDWKRSLGDHLLAYGRVDIALDSFPYHGTTTTCEALWMGVPVVSVEGDRHAARVGSSLLHAVGLEELLAVDVEGYIATAAALAGDRARLKALRAGLRDRMRLSPLTDAPRFTRNLERAYLDMWEERLKGASAARSLDPAALGRVLERAHALRAAGKLAEAGEAYGEVLLGSPDHAEALAAIFDIAFESANPGAAVDWLNKAISVRPDAASFHYMLGCSLQAQGKVSDAIESFSQALVIDPAFAKAHNNFGCTLEAAGQLQNAMHCYSRATELDPKLAVALYNLGNGYRQLGNIVQAIECFRGALVLEPSHTDWRCNLGDALYERLQLDDAVASYRMAIDLDPAYARAHCGLGMALKALGRPEEAVAAFRRAMELDPESADIRSNLLFTLHYQRAEERQALFEEHLEWDRRHALGVGWQAARTEEERRLKGRLKIAYLSPDFRWHPVAHFIEPVLGAHDRAKVELFCYSDVAHPDEITQRMQALCENWRDVSRLKDEEVVERMRFDGIDILVELAGHSGGGRLRLMASKPAPVQVTWIGYPNTTGLRAIDYRLTDSCADPLGESDALHVENLVRLETGFLCYQPPADSPDIEQSPSSLAAGITFGCLNTLPKITSSVIALWSSLLAALPGSRLLLKAYGLSAESARQDLLARFEKHGIDAARLKLVRPEDSTLQHLGWYNQIDIALDVFPYNGTTTTCEALWMGVPVITLCGNSHVSRVGASLLSRVGLADLVATSEAEYLAKALAMAANADARRELRLGLRQRMKDSPLLDAARFTRGLEAAYEEMWANYSR